MAYSEKQSSISSTRTNMTSFTPSRATLLEEVKQVVTEIHEFDYQDETSRKVHVKSLVYQDSSAATKFLMVFEQIHKKNRNVSVATTVEEVKPVVLENYELEQKDILFFVAHFRHSGTLGL